MTIKTDFNLGTGIKLPPPIIYLAALIIGVVLDDFWPFSPLSEIWGHIIGSVLILVSILLVPTFLIQFKKAGTTFDVRKSATTLITNGPYRYSRNPAYISLTLLYLGLGAFFHNAWIIVIVIPVLLIMDLWIVRKEERHLEAKFGEEYLRYKSVVHRWL